VLYCRPPSYQPAASKWYFVEKVWKLICNNNLTSTEFRKVTHESLADIMKVIVLIDSRSSYMYGKSRQPSWFGRPSMHRHDQYRACLPSYCFLVPTRIAECLLMISALPSPTTLHPPPNYHCSYSDSEFPRPLSCCSLVSGTVGLVDVSDFRNKRVVRIGVGKHRADGEKH
jgi:hypothetical protein